MTSRVKSVLIALLCVFPIPGAVDAEQPATSPPVNPSDAAPRAPDYGLPSSWAAWPGRDGPASAMPAGASPRALHPKVDVFYIHPTTDRSKLAWNQDLADRDVNAWTDDSVIARQAGIFNGCCRIFAPRYRQATVASFATPQSRREAFSVAYGDVLRAFDRFIEQGNHGRPFILVGHSQGAFHLARLLQDRIDGSPLAARMVAAYVVGINVAAGDFGQTYKTLSFCQKPDQTGCVVSWNAMLPDADKKAFIAFSAKAYAERHGDAPGNTLLCVNPLTFDTSKPSAGKEASQGAVPGKPGFGPPRPLVPHSVSARCEDGVLVVQPDPALGLEPIAGGIMHYHDFGLFYQDIRSNIAVRIAHYLAQPRRGG